LRRYTNLEGQDEECAAILGEIAKSREARTATKPSVFLLARYWHQCPAELDAWRSRFKNILEISFKTIHSSKGLEADCVIILGLAAGRFSFPSTISDDPLYELVMPRPEAFEHAEERRLFYVAMTRAKRRVYLLAHCTVPSPFVNELFSERSLRKHLRIDAAQAAERGGDACPNCGTGKLKRRNGKFGEFWGCSNYPICRYTRDDEEA
jgi:DNA helicase-4